MSETTDTIAVSRLELEAIERRCVRISVLMTRLRSALEKNDREKVLNLWEEARELNWITRRELLARGVRDSVRGDGPFPPDDDDLIDTDALDLSTLPPPSSGNELE